MLELLPSAIGPLLEKPSDDLVAAMRSRGSRWQRLTNVRRPTVDPHLIDGIDASTEGFNERDYLGEVLKADAEIRTRVASIFETNSSLLAVTPGQSADGFSLELETSLQMQYQLVQGILGRLVDAPGRSSACLGARGAPSDPARAEV